MDPFIPQHPHGRSQREQQAQPAPAPTILPRASLSRDTRHPARHPATFPALSSVPKAPGSQRLQDSQGRTHRVKSSPKKKTTRKRGEPGRGTSLPSPPPPPQPTFPHSIPFLPEFREMEHNTPSRSRPLLPLSLLFLHPGCTGHFPPGSSSLPSSRQRLQGRKTNEKQLLGIPEG